MAERRARLAVLISGRGRNLEAIQRAIATGSLAAEIVRVFCNRASAPGLACARDTELATTLLRARDYADRESYDQALGDAVAATRPDWVALAGYMRILAPAFVARFQGRLVNIHPSLLPAYKGLDTHARALAAGAARHGASVHFVTNPLDDGPIIRQGWTRVCANDTPTSLADRVMGQVEQRLYPTALAELIAGRVVYCNGVVYRDGARQTEPPSDCYDSN